MKKRAAVKIAAKKFMASGIRPPSFAGTFYPADKNELQTTLSNFFQNSQKIIPPGKNIKALIVPHAGFLYSGQTAAWGYRQLSQNRHFVLIGPSHRFELAASSARFWQTPLGRVKHLPASPINDPAHLPEHCLEVQLPFLQSLYPQLSVTCFLTSVPPNLPKTASWLSAQYPKSTFIISSDLSHYLPQSQAAKKDQNTIQAILNLDSQYFLHEENTACGMIGILLLMHLAKLQKWQSQLVCYDTSATASGDPAAVVGYAAIAFYV
jgi:AmmeMemoRadiSam system protein B